MKAMLSGLQTLRDRAVEAALRTRDARTPFENEEAREQMRRASRDFFERKLHADNLTAYYLRPCLDRLPG